LIGDNRMAGRRQGHRRDVQNLESIIGDARVSLNRKLSEMPENVNR
jgi:hypothetical protein